MTRITQLDHFGVPVRDLREACDWYISFLGMKVRHDSSNLDPAVATPNIQVQSGAVVIFLFPLLRKGESLDILPGPSPTVAFRVQQPDSALAYLQAHGCSSEGPVRLEPDQWVTYFKDLYENVLAFDSTASHEGSGDGAGLGIAGFSRVHLPVSDLERAREFYEAVCGLRLTADRSHAEGYQTPHAVLAADRLTVALYQAKKPGDYLQIRKNGVLDYTPRSRTRVLHHAFRVADRDAIVRRLEEMDYPYEFYEGRGSGAGEVYVNDPDGNRLEFVAQP